MRLTLPAPAKVNLHLRVLGRRADGYHDLLTLMQPLSLADQLSVDLDAEGLSLECDRADLAGPENLALRAARAYFAALDRPARARLTLVKRVPVAAGLGGGSSDAAAALMALNALHGGALAPEALVGLAAGLGADVAFFLGGVTGLCAGVGERVSPWPDFPLLHYVLVNPGIAVSTAWVYQQLDLAWTSDQSRTTINCPSSLSEVEGLLANDLERVTLRAHPELGQIKAALFEVGAWGALMSGSGPTVFGIFEGPREAARAARKLAGRARWWVQACQGIQA